MARRSKKNKRNTRLSGRAGVRPYRTLQQSRPRTLTNYPYQSPKRLPVPKVRRRTSGALPNATTQKPVYRKTYPKHYSPPGLRTNPRLCSQRRQRRSALFAMGKAGRGISHRLHARRPSRNYRRTAESNITCKR